MTLSDTEEVTERMSGIGQGARLWRVEIVARSPLTFPTRKPGAQFRQSTDYVPGAAVFGALGYALAPKGLADPALLQRLRCHNAYPAWPCDAWSRPLPRTAAVPKGADTVRASDTLVDRVCWEQMQPPALIYSPTDQQGRAWESDSGFYAIPEDGDLRKQIKRRVPQRIITRVSINRRRGTAENELLYSFLALSEVNTRRVYGKDEQQPAQEHVSLIEFPSRFLGSIVVPRDIDLRSELKAIDRIGGRLTTGLGVVEVKLSEDADVAETSTDVARRIAKMTEKFRNGAQQWGRLGGKPWMPTGSVFTVNLVSDAILYEQGWRPTMEFTADMLREATGIRADLLRSFASYGYAGGWNVSWGAPKPTEVSTSMGSVFVFATDEELDDAACQRLARLQLDGIGERRSEGYGQVRICDDFHLGAIGGE